MVTESMVLASNREVAVEKLVHANTDDFDTEADFANSARIVSDDLGAFVSPYELEEFLRNFSEGTDEEAELQTQGEADVGGEPTTTVH